MKRAFAAAFLALAESNLRAGRAEDAQRLTEQALKLRPSGQTLAVGRSLLGVALLLQGSADGALEQLELAEEDFKAALGADHPMTLLFALNRALALERLDRRSEALRLIERAQPILQRALGPDAPTYSRVLALRARLEQAATAGRRPDNGKGQRTVEFFS